MESMYDEDPRVTWYENGVAVVRTIPWELGTLIGVHDPEYTIVQDHSSGYWYAVCDGDELHPDTVRGKQTGDDAICAVIGPPLWSLQADMIDGALTGNGFLPAPEQETPGEVAAIDNLVTAGVFEDGHDGYRLTEAGLKLAAALAGCATEAQMQPILTRVPQQQAT
jgi:hypothetical protein